jgi:hypothetical protein
MCKKSVVLLTRIRFLKVRVSVGTDYAFKNNFDEEQRAYIVGTTVESKSSLNRATLPYLPMFVCISVWYLLSFYPHKRETVPRLQLDCYSCIHICINIQNFVLYSFSHVVPVPYRNTACPSLFPSYNP